MLDGPVSDDFSSVSTNNDFNDREQNNRIDLFECEGMEGIDRSRNFQVITLKIIISMIYLFK